MRYRAIRPIDTGKLKLMPGEFVPEDAPKSVIKRLLKQDAIAIKHEGEPKWQKDEQLETDGHDAM